MFPDIADHVDFFEALPEYDTAMYTHKKMKTNAETSLKVFNGCAASFGSNRMILPTMPFTVSFQNMWRTLGLRPALWMWPIRTAVSG